MWDAPTLLHPHFGRGLRDFTVSRIFYEPLAAPTVEGSFAPVLADELPSVKNGGVAKDGQWVIWRLKRNVVWHDGAPFTADDVMFNWQFAIDPANATSTRAGYEEVSRVEKLDSHTVKVNYKKPQPFWASVFTGDGLLPRHIFEPLKGAGARDAVGMVKAVGTGPYKLVEFKPGDLIRAEINPNYHVPNRPFFDRLEIKCGGDSTGATRAVLQTGEYDFAYYVLVEEEVLRRVEQGGKGRVLSIPSAGVSFVQCNQSDPWTAVEGERSSPRSLHPFLSDQAVRTALGLLVDRSGIHDHVLGRAGQPTANFLVAPERFRSRNTSWEFNIDKANQVLDQAGWARGADGIRVKDIRRLKMVFQGGRQLHRPEDPGRGEAGGGAGGHRDGDQGHPGVGVLLCRREQPGHEPPVPGRPADLHDLHQPRSPVLHGAVPLHRPAVQGEQLDGAQHRPLAEPRVRPGVEAGRGGDGPRQAGRAASSR